MRLQRTIQKNLRIEGVGLHSGERVVLRLKPANPNTGIWFIRKDMEGSPRVKASIDNVVDTRLATTIQSGKARVSTIEHLMAALAGLGIDNLLCEVDGPELPILDGSSLEFCVGILQAGVQTQFIGKPVLELKKRVEVRIGDKIAVAEPSDRLSVKASIEWDHPAIGAQEFHYDENESDFDEIASSRTFGFLKDVENLKKMGLARGGSLDNAVVLDESGVINPTGLRHEDEMVRHKVLDALGDFKLADYSISASITLHKGGHELHAKLLEAIFADASNYRIVEAGSDMNLLLYPGREEAAVAI